MGPGRVAELAAGAFIIDRSICYHGDKSHHGHDWEARHVVVLVRGKDER